MGSGSSASGANIAQGVTESVANNGKAVATAPQTNTCEEVKSGFDDDLLENLIDFGLGVIRTGQTTYGIDAAVSAVCAVDRMANEPGAPELYISSVMKGRKPKTNLNMTTQSTGQELHHAIEYVLKNQTAKENKAFAGSYSRMPEVKDNTMIRYINDNRKGHKLAKLLCAVGVLDACTKRDLLADNLAAVKRFLVDVMHKTSPETCKMYHLLQEGDNNGAFQFILKTYTNEQMRVFIQAEAQQK
jgi:hypothetical protein